MKIGIIGRGVVGQTIQVAFGNLGHEIYCYDKNQPEHQDFNVLLSCDCIFVCVPTDLVDDCCDLSHVNEQVRNLAENRYLGEVIIKSTVLPGTTERLIVQYTDLKLNFVPEFLRQDYALEDFSSKDLPVFVGTHQSSSFLFISKLHEIFGQRSLHITPTEAELVKYFSNVLNSTRIVFANVFFEVCEKIGADYQNVLKAAVDLPNIQNDSYLRCGADLRGYSGKCLPKDIAAFSTFAKNLGIPVTLFDAVIKDNRYYVK